MAIIANAQSATYNDVIVLANSTDSTSLQIAHYFAQQRGIPNSRIIAFPMPRQETITAAQFAVMRTVLDSLVNLRNLRDSFSYIVTTKGMPLRISVDTQAYYAGEPYGSRNASVESELALMFSPQLAPYIGDSLAVLNPYYQSTTTFHPANFMGLRLVTRLDGYSYQDVRQLIDRSGPSRYVDKSSARVVIDRDPVWDSLLTNFFATYYADTDTLWDDFYDSAIAQLAADGWTVVYDRSPTYLTQQQNVIAYNSWGSNDYSFGPRRNDTSAVPNNQWLDGALAVWYVSTSGRSFQPGMPYGQSLVADLIREGVSGTIGYVFEPFFSAMPDLDLLFSNYLLSSRHLNLAEAFYSALRPLSWMGVVIGDPKTSISTVSTVASPSRPTPHFAVSPNPAQSIVVVTGADVVPGGRLQLLNVQGRVVRDVAVRTAHYQRVFVGRLPRGLYFARLKTPDGRHAVQPFVKQ